MTAQGVRCRTVSSSVKYIGHGLRIENKDRKDPLVDNFNIISDTFCVTHVHCTMSECGK